MKPFPSCPSRRIVDSDFGGQILVTFLSIFERNILPAFMVVGAGVLMGRYLGVDKRSLSRMAIYILSPCLVFGLVVESTIDLAAFGQMMLYAVAVTVGSVLLALGVGRLLRWSSHKVDSLVLSVAFVNSGNLGLSIILFSYGEPGLALGSAFFVVTNLSTHTLAAFFAARGGHGDSWRAILQVLRLPAIYACVLAFSVRLLQVEVPQVIMEPVGLVGRAAVPVMLLMLGVQLSETRLAGGYRDLSVGVGLRLVIGAVLAVGLAWLMGLEGLARKVGVVQASMPTAVTSSLMAIEFEADAEYVTGVIFLSTLLSAVTLTVLLALV